MILNPLNNDNKSTYLSSSMKVLPLFPCTLSAKCEIQHIYVLDADILTETYT